MSDNLPLPHLPLGSSGLEIAPLSLGCVKLGRNTGVKYPNSFDLPSDAQASALLDTAESLGLNLLDTAPAYGSSEERLGTLLEQRTYPWRICTKVGEVWDNQQSHFDFSAQGCRDSVARSMTRLQRNHLDMVLIHSSGEDLQALACAHVLQDMQRSGQIGAVGLSAKTGQGALAALEAGLDLLMLTLNPADQSLAEVIAHCAGQGMGILIKKPLSSGFGKTEDLTWVAKQSGVHSIVTGTLNPDHLRANAVAVSKGVT